MAHSATRAARTGGANAPERRGVIGRERRRQARDQREPEALSTKGDGLEEHRAKDNRPEEDSHPQEGNGAQDDRNPQEEGDRAEENHGAQEDHRAQDDGSALDRRPKEDRGEEAPPLGTLILKSEHLVH